MTAFKLGETYKYTADDGWFTIKLDRLTSTGNKCHTFFADAINEKIERDK